MSVFDDYPFQHSRRVYSYDLPEDFFHIIPSRISILKVGHEDIGQEYDEWIQSLDGNTPPAYLDSASLSNLLHVFPECPPDRRDATLKFSRMFTVWGDALSDLETTEQQSLVDDLALAIVTSIKTGSPTSCDHAINQLFYDAFVQLMQQLAVNESQNKMILEGFLGFLRSQTESPLDSPIDSMTFEAYKEQRSISSPGTFISLLIPLCHGLDVSEEEQTSILPFIKLGSLITSLTNDFESFHLTANVTHTAMGILMANYSYTDEEARMILEEEILSLERKMLAEYDAWKMSSSSKSDDMCRYMALCLLGVGNTCRLHATLPMYNWLYRTKTFAEYSAQVASVGRNKTGYRLQGYPPPALPWCISDTPNENPQTIAEIQGDILAPFERAPAEQIALAPYDYTTSTPGKKTIAGFIESLRCWLRLSDDSASVIEGIASMLFHSSLMIDDIEDDSMLRRGKPSAHLVFGKSQVINSATFLYARATRELDQLQQAECKTAFLDELENLALGQALDLYWKFQKTCPTTREYLIMVDNKRVASSECGTKGYCEDLSEGKLSFPLIHALQNSPAADQLRVLLFHWEGGHELSFEVKKYIVSEMNDAGSLAHTRDTAMQLYDAIMETLGRVEANLGPNKRLKALLLWLKL